MQTIGRRRVALLAAACVVLAAVALSSAVHGLLLHLLGATESIIERHALLGAVTFVVLAAVSAMLAFISVAVLVPAAVYAWGAPTSIGLLWLGWIPGYVLGLVRYPVARYLLALAVAELPFTVATVYPVSYTHLTLPTILRV